MPEIERMSEAKMRNDIMYRYYAALMDQLPSMPDKDKLDALCKAAFAFKCDAADGQEHSSGASENIRDKAEEIFTLLHKNALALCENADADKKQEILLDTAAAFHGMF